MKQPIKCIVRMIYYHRLNYYLYERGDKYLQIWSDFTNVPIKNTYNNHAHTFVKNIKLKDSIWRDL